MTDELNDVFSRIGLSDTNNSDCLPFKPHVHSSQSLPRHLFRLSTTKSDGNGSEYWIQSKDAAAGLYREDLFSREDVQQTAAEISDHLWWVNQPDRRDNLVSWTSSLLFACQYAFYRHLDYRDGSPLPMMKLTIIDTTLFSPSIFIRDMELIKAFQSYDSGLSKLHNVRTSGFYYGEYLMQGSLRIYGKCTWVSIQDLIDGGLFTLQPEFAIDENLWAKKVNRLRKKIINSSGKPIANDERQAVINIVSLLEPGYRLPMATHLLSLLLYRCTKESVTALFRAPEFDSKSTHNSLINLTMQDLPKDILSTLTTKLIHYDMPEVEQASEIASIAYADYVEQQLKQAIGNVTSAETSLRSAMINLYGVTKNGTQAANLDRTHLGQLVERLECVILLCKAIGDNCEATT